MGNILKLMYTFRQQANSLSSTSSVSRNDDLFYGMTKMMTCGFVLRGLVLRRRRPQTVLAATQFLHGSNLSHLIYKIDMYTYRSANYPHSIWILD